MYNLYNMDYEKKYQELISWYKLPDVKDKYPLANPYELCILSMRNMSWSYAEIQKPLGMPSKKAIRAVLKAFDPELIEIDTNYKKLVKKRNITLEEGVFRYHCIQTNQWKWNLQGDDYVFEIRDNILYFKDPDGFEMKFSDLDETTRKQFTNEQRAQIIH